ncbi:armadillo-type protein [Vararia minispora EC-137]|uniref:Armadillo-type protein n=1 Tax=Vararia minispora EC-137 TaxID=1314806 RepID=A0ACB8Q8H8_9AGAM|nr:armadillo-type protein [Vararia minispora EC-137]
MFKSILPSKRTPVDAEFTMVTPYGDTVLNGKENQRIPSAALKSGANSRTTKQSLFSDRYRGKKSLDLNPQSCETNQAFGRLLDDLQIPDSLRPKLLGMESNVKEAMLKSSHTLAMPPPTRPATPSAPRGLRRVQSGSSLSIESPRPQRVTSNFYQQPSLAISGTTLVDARHARGSSMDLTRPKSRGVGFADKGSKEKSSMKNLSPVQLVSQLTGTSSLALSVEVVKKLRLMLRNEAASWTQEFLKSGGYSALLTRLNELLEVEWREEQHDDQLLHELLRCLKALSTSSIGCFALRSSCPTPFVQLVALLYSDKKPGEVATRQLIVDLLLILFELYPASALPTAGSSRLRQSKSDGISLPYPHTSLFSFLRSLLLTPAPAPAEAPETTVSPHEFIESLHRQRIYKTHLQELSDVCRDYFWVFCHPNNAIWILAETDEGKVEKPKAPGGMTGGVEFEAMSYMTAHFRLLNALAKAALDNGLQKEDPMSAYQFHKDLFLSGLERILLIARKASTTYYPTLHLEIARYAALAALARFELPWTVGRLMGPPPTGLGRRVSRPPTIATGSASGSPQASPTKRSGTGTPVLPSPRHVEPIRFE